MDTVITQETTLKVKKVKKSSIVDQGLTDNLSNKEIVEKVRVSFPETAEKSIRNLISVRRSRMKKKLSQSVQSSNGT